MKLMIYLMLVLWSVAGVVNASSFSQTRPKPYPRITLPRVFPDQYSGMVTNLTTNAVQTITYSNQTTSLTNVFGGATNVYTVVTGSVPITNAVEVVSTNTEPSINPYSGRPYSDFILVAYDGTNCVYFYESKEGLNVESPW